MDSILSAAGKELLSQGLLGIIIFFLIWYIGRVQGEHKADKEAYETRLAAKDKLIEQLHSERLSDAKQFVELAQELRTQGQAFLAAIERKS